MKTVPLVLSGQYRPEVIAERQSIISTLRTQQETQSFPIVEGLTYDRAGTNIREQGLSFSYTESGQPRIGYHIIDVSLIPVGGEFDLLGYAQQAQAGGTKQETLFGDFILRRNLSLDVQGDQPQPVPTITFWFERKGDRLQVTDIERTLFQNTAALTFGSFDEKTDDVRAKPLMDALDDNMAVKRLNNLRQAEKILSIEAALVAVTRLTEVGIEPFNDEQGHTNFHRPLRQWADFKNLQLLAKVLDDDAVLYRQDQLAAMAARSRGQTRDFDRSDIIEDELAGLLQDLLKSVDLKQRKLSMQEFDALVDHFDPDINEGDPLLARIMLWAQRHGLIDVEMDVNRPERVILKFANVVEPLSLDAGNRTIDDLAYEAMVTYVQKCPRPREGVGHRERMLLGKMKQEAEMHKLYTRVEESQLINFFNNMKPRIKTQRRSPKANHHRSGKAR